MNWRKNRKILEEKNKVNENVRDNLKKFVYKKIDEKKNMRKEELVELVK